MADTNTTVPTLDPLAERTRSNLAYISIFGAFFMLTYILFKCIDKIEIVTLIIGLIGGTILGAVYGVYFAGSFSKKADTTTTPITGDNSTVINNVSPNPDPLSK